MPPVQTGVGSGGDALDHRGGGGAGVALTPAGYDEPLELPDGCHHISLAKFLEVKSLRLDIFYPTSLFPEARVATPVGGGVGGSRDSRLPYDGPLVGFWLPSQLSLASLLRRRIEILSLAIWWVLSTQQYWY